MREMIGRRGGAGRGGGGRIGEVNGWGGSHQGSRHGYGSQEGQDGIRRDHTRRYTTATARTGGGAPVDEPRSSAEQRVNRVVRGRGRNDLFISENFPTW